MEFKEIDLGTLRELLEQLIKRASEDRPTTAAIFRLCMNTGLRIGEALTVERWKRLDKETWLVQVQKAEATRKIPDYAIPDELRWYYENGQPFVWESYSSVNNTFRRRGPVVVFNDKTRASTNHAFRYYYIKKLAAEGWKPEQIQEDVGHVSAKSTEGYIEGRIFAWVEESGEIGTGSNYADHYGPPPETTSAPLLTPEQYAKWYEYQQQQQQQQQQPPSEAAAAPPEAAAAAPTDETPAPAPPK